MKRLIMRAAIVAAVAASALVPTMAPSQAATSAGTVEFAGTLTTPGWSYPGLVPVVTGGVVFESSRGCAGGATTGADASCAVEASGSGTGNCGRWTATVRGSITFDSSTVRIVGATVDLVGSTATVRGTAVLGGASGPLVGTLQLATNQADVANRCLAGNFTSWELVGTLSYAVA
ncbi:MAG: hypothetical protein M3394_02935 [Actinomycetota bacterium]|nr:hypothetical protein [Actinomycetota bacterium]